MLTVCTNVHCACMPIYLFVSRGALDMAEVIHTWLREAVDRSLVLQHSHRQQALVFTGGL